MKIERLIGIITTLQQKEKVTAPYLAEKFEVSRRTINRDIEEICRAGIPILPFYIEKNNGLNKYHISVFGINGAHAYLYKNLLKTLTVPALIITDLDIKNETEAEKELQVDSLQGKSTTNNTLIHFFNDESEITSLKEYIMDNNIYVTYQGAVEGYYATSFEEALILTNYNNEILNTALKKTRRNTYNNIVGKANNYRSISVFFS